MRVAVLLLGMLFGLTGCVVYDDDHHHGYRDGYGRWDDGRHHRRWDGDDHRYRERHRHRRERWEDRGDHDRVHYRPYRRYHD